MSKCSLTNRYLTIEDAKVFYMDMKGGKFGRSFCAAIDEDMADELRKSGWNVKTREPREEGDVPTYYIPVAVKFGNYPPAVYIINGKSKTLLNENNIGTLDSMKFSNVDLIISPYTWDDDGIDRVKAYLKTMYATVETDYLAKKYAYLDEDVTDEDTPF